jgi:hypothetical protein
MISRYVTKLKINKLKEFEETYFGIFVAEKQLIVTDMARHSHHFQPR